MVVLSFCIFSQYTFAQEVATEPEKYTAHNKGKFFFYWGGNRETYTKSDLHFKGDGYNFTVQDAVADDKPKGWHIDYINPGKMTIPQTNLKVGYFISDHYNISIGVDHMKYVMRTGQTANINGTINLPESHPGHVYNGTYNNNPTELAEDFLDFEHTDGLNYINAEFARVDDISKLFRIGNTDKFQVNITEGVGGGILYPRTNAKVLGMPRNDEFHVAGYGFSAKAGLNLTFFKHFFVTGELKGGYIDMYDVRTTHDGPDRAHHHFGFLQRIIAVGGIFRV
ncbi:hypothetical protein [Flavobacterium sp. AG291]|uniref:hypothetical protein n=1 Tax=Flavobacterium sp. AG291 TaxID=2184000 RepID=UPI000E0A0A15|nr:hypothetical protein [Flavobacterium sp. AG291]RDI07011.1 hypothetical protein DEU42_113110 [Flavobacterium sp. AG291]